MYRIFYVEDDATLEHQVKTYLESYDYEVVTVQHFNAIDQEFQCAQPDLVLMDINLPYFDGYYFCRQIRKMSTVPIIFLSARTESFEQVMALDLGGDDYITKPFDWHLLLAKIKVLLRRSCGDYTQNEGVYILNGLTLNDANFKLRYQDKVVELSKNECKIIKAMLMRPSEVFTREELLNILWDEEAFVDYNTLTVNMTRVKKQLKKLGLFNVISTKRGIGYVFNENF